MKLSKLYTNMFKEEIIENLIFSLNIDSVITTSVSLEKVLVLRKKDLRETSRLIKIRKYKV